MFYTLKHVNLSNLLPQISLLKKLASIGTLKYIHIEEYNIINYNFILNWEE